MPFISSIRLATIDIPKPVPPKRRVIVLSACAKGTNSDSICV
ncbi:Uncharacterised protein [Vibrio cholerae]|nr:Uncharacterised protein [Vibrio cholerae]CSI42566.1 Uncharacterised protein [Vibrio cholerae]